MEKIVEFDLKNKELKQYLEKCLTEENIEYELKIEEKWIQGFHNPSHYYQVYSVYVNSDKRDRVEKIINNFENGIIITDSIKELENAEDEEENNLLKKFTVKNFIKYFFGVLIIIGILIIIVSKLTYPKT